MGSTRRGRYGGWKQQRSKLMAGVTMYSKPFLMSKTRRENWQTEFGCVWRCEENHPALRDISIECKTRGCGGGGGGSQDAGSGVVTAQDGGNRGPTLRTCWEACLWCLSWGHRQVSLRKPMSFVVGLSLAGASSRERGSLDRVRLTSTDRHDQCGQAPPFTRAERNAVLSWSRRKHHRYSFF